MWITVCVLASILLTLGILYQLRHPKETDGCRVHDTRILDDGTRLELVNDDCKEGLPHTTTNDTVRMTQRIADSSRVREILTHERVHLDQKTRPAFWRDLVSRIWAYDLRSTPPTGVPAPWVSLLRPNPDTDAAPWAVWRGRYVFFAAFQEDKRLRTATTRVWDLAAGSLVEPPPEWQAEFCGAGACPHQSEHPYEIAAEYITHESQSPASARLSTALAEAPGPARRST